MRVYLVLGLILLVCAPSIQRQRRGRQRIRGVLRRRSNSCRIIDAAVRLPNDGKTYFFYGNRYIEYDKSFSTEKSTGMQRSLKLGNRRLHAVFQLTDMANEIITVRGCQYRRYQANNEEITTRIGPWADLFQLGLPCDIDAGFKLNNVTTVTKGCDLWKYNPDTQRFEMYLATDLTALGLPCQINAAVSWSDSTILVIKGHTYWEFDGQLVTRGPVHTDQLNMCSVFLCGEADFSRSDDNSSTFACNGDQRWCPLRLDQVTLPGLHNSGAGFGRGFGFLNCWLRNHERSILEQLQLGIRHLDIDPCYDTCGFLGSCHSSFCGGSICSIIKQTRRFLLDNPNEIVTLNFNHEIVDLAKVFGTLTRQLKTQMAPMLNSNFREHHHYWPTLQESVQSNKRVFVFYAWEVQHEQHVAVYNQHKWIHTESWLGSTWDEFTITETCGGLLSVAQRQCYRRQSRELLEVSAVATPSFTACIKSNADRCRPRLMDTLQICQPYRYRHNKSPNVLLVDYPQPQAVPSVFSAVHVQNSKNVLQHRPYQCRVVIDAAVAIGDESIFFSGSKLVHYDNNIGMQSYIRDLPEELHNIDAAYEEMDGSAINVIKDCEVWQIDLNTLTATTEKQPINNCTHRVDSAFRIQNEVYLLQGCNAHIGIFIHYNANGIGTTEERLQQNIPCDVDAILKNEGDMYLFRGNHYVLYDGTAIFTYQNLTTNWNIDVIKCVY